MLRVAIVMLGEDRESWALELHEWTQLAEPPLIIAAVPTRSADAVRLALRAGAHDVVFIPADAIDLARCLVKLAETRNLGSGRHSAIVCALASIAGGVGVSSLTVALGFALQHRTRQRVALVDLGLQGGALAALLDIEPEHSIGELIDPTVTVDSLRMESVMTVHSSGLYLLAAPQRLEESEMVSVGTIGAALGVMRELFDFVLVDCGHHVTEGVVAAWEHSQRLLYVVEQSVTSVLPAQRFLDLFGRLKLRDLKVDFVVNRFDRHSPFTLDKVESALGRPLTLKVPRDDDAFVRMQIDQPDLSVVAPQSAARAGLDEIAAALCGLTTAPNGRHNGALFARLRSAVGL
jgi:pilus assembly protein CpaE